MAHCMRTGDWAGLARVATDRVAVSCVNTAFRGIALPPGHHNIRFTYRPKSLNAGIWVSALVLFLCLSNKKLLIFLPPLREMRSRRPTP